MHVEGEDTMSRADSSVVAEQQLDCRQKQHAPQMTAFLLQNRLRLALHAADL
jgi:hypothetical protein